MFCPNCGKEIKEGVSFCPSCGAKIGTPAEKVAASEPVQNVASTQGAPVNGSSVQTVKTDEIVKITGKRAGVEVGAAKSIIAFLLDFILGFLLAILWGIITDSDNENVQDGLLFLPLIVSFILLRLSMPKNISFDSRSNRFVINKKKFVPVAELKSIKLRNVKLGLSLKQPASNPGAYFVLLLDTGSKKSSISLWFEKKEEFNAAKVLVTAALKNSVPVDENLEQISHKEFYKNLEK